MKRRFGEFSAKSYLPIVLMGGVLLLTGMLFLCLESLSNLLGWLLLLIAPAPIFVSYLPHREQFEFTNNSIRCVVGRSVRSILLPSKMIVIVSDADVNRMWAVRDPIGLSLHMNLFSGQYAISILEHMPLNSVLERLHGQNFARYTNATIEDTFTPEFIYSFVCDCTQLDEFLGSRECMVIVPQTIVPQFHEILLKHPNAGMYIDKNY